MAAMFTSLRRSSQILSPKVLLGVLLTLTWLLYIYVYLQSPSHTLHIELNPNRIIRPEEAERLYSGEYLLSEHQNPSDGDVLEKQRQNILQELQGIPLHPGLGVRKVAELVPELGGKAISTLLVTSWRFGSAFLGAVLNAHPGTFYYYEPLHDFGIRQIRPGEQDDGAAVARISQLLRCDYSGIDRFVSYASRFSEFMLAGNTRLWWVCRTFKTFCKRPEFLAAFCKQFPFNLAKVTRLRMALTEPLLDERRLSVKVIMLVRDPRGALTSRRPHDWCQKNADCWDPAILCRDMVSDFHAAHHLRNKFPGRVMVIRYEDLSPNIFNVTRDVFDFLSFSFSDPVQQFLHEHTKSNKNSDPFNTFRDSSVVYLQWRNQLTFKEVDAIQSQCRDAMNLFGYRIVTAADDIVNFNPVDVFNFPTL